MHRIVRILKYLLPVLFIGFIALIALNWRKPHRNPPKPDAIPTSTSRPHDVTNAVSKVFEDTQTINGHLAMHIKASVLVSFTSGWNTLDDVTLTIYRPNNLTYVLLSPHALFNASTKETDVKGEVHLTSSDGVDIQTAEMHFDGTHLTNHVRVNFKVDNWTGTAGALDLAVKEEMLHLFEKIDGTMAPETPADAPMHVVAQDGVYRRKENSADFTTDVVMTRDRDRFNAARVSGRFGADRHTLTSLEGQGNVLIALGANSPLASGGAAAGRKEITCDHFWSEVGPAATIDAINAVADGTNMAHAFIEGDVRRDITAKTFRVGLKDKLITNIKADQQVVMKETGGEAPREITGDNVLVNFDMATNRPGSAVIDGNFHYKDPKNDARAVRANYDITNDHVVLTAQPGFDPTVNVDGDVLRAKLIEFSPRGGTAKASGSVIAQLTSKANGTSAAADSTNIFPAGKPVFVNSDAVTMQQANKTALFSGNVRAWQETNTLLSRELQVEGAGEHITARGNVRTTLYNTGSTEARKTPLLAKGDTLIAHKNDRRIELHGNVAIDDELRHMTGENAIFLFDANRKVDRVDADTKVILLDPANSRKVTGDRAQYLVSKHLVYIWGSPAVVTAPNGTTSGQEFVLDTLHNRVDSISPTAPTTGTYKEH
jgi:lipopolysaccharide export system protein LptA